MCTFLPPHLGERKTAQKLGNKIFPRRTVWEAYTEMRKAKIINESKKLVVQVVRKDGTPRALSDWRSGPEEMPTAAACCRSVHRSGAGTSGQNSSVPSAQKGQH